MSELGARLAEAEGLAPDTQGGGVHTWIHVRATPFPLRRWEGARRSQAAHHGGDSTWVRGQSEVFAV